uniref:Uncharacterized protein n=1 Tax=Arundo donax TaxID=35708 RepID=A0A0A9GC83_ARUDO
MELSINTCSCMSPYHCSSSCPSAPSCHPPPSALSLPIVVPPHPRPRTPASAHHGIAIPSSSITQMHDGTIA